MLALISLLLLQLGSVQGNECTKESCHQNLEDEVSLVQVKMEAKERKTSEDSAKPKISVVINIPTEPPMPPMMNPMMGAMGFQPPAPPCDTTPAPGQYKTCKTDAFKCPTGTSNKPDYDHLLCDNQQCTSDLCCTAAQGCTCENGIPATGETCTHPGTNMCIVCNSGYNHVFVSEESTCKTKCGSSMESVKSVHDKEDITEGGKEVANQTHNDPSFLQKGLSSSASSTSAICVKALNTYVVGTITAADYPKEGVKCSSEDQVQAACDKDSECKGYWKRGSGEYFPLMPGSRTFSKGKPNPTVALVMKKKACGVQGCSKCPGDPNTCTQCDAGYGLSNNQCKANACQCPGGTAVTGTACTKAGAIKCSKCNSGFTLKEGQCQAVPKTCKSSGFKCPSDKNPKPDFGYLLCGSGSCDAARCCQDQASGSASATASNNVDCKVSDWTSWGACTSGLHIRTRSILTYPANNGHACPEISESSSC